MPNPNSIEISFLGGATSIGASCILVRVAGSAFVVDCGVRYSGSSPLPDLSMLRNGTLAGAPVFVDGMVRAVCEVYRNHEPFVSRSLSHEIRRTPHAFYTDSIQPVMRREDRTRVLDTSPCIIVASSGMLSGGPSAGYCQELAKNANDAVLLTGYQDEESPGRALLELARSEGPKQLRLGQAKVPVACLYIQPRGAFYAAKMSLCYEGRTLDCGPYRAASKKTAEQMAAQGLLDMVSQGDDEHEVVRVASADASRLQATNPKGNLLEWCAKHKITGR